MPTYRDQLGHLARCVRVIEGSGFRWFGRRVAATAVDPGEGSAMDQLRALLAQHLYDFFYVTGAPVPTGVRLIPARDHFDGGLVDTIVAGISGAGPWETGWRLAGIHPGGTMAEHDGIAFLVSAVDAHLTRPTDAGLAVRQPTCLRTAQPGFCFVLGDTPFPVTRTRRMTRFYWNLFTDGAPALTHALTRELNDRSIPFSLKLVNSEDGYSRCDAAVLFVPGDHLPGVLDAVARQRANVAWALKDGVPALTKQLAPGIAAAEDPDTGESFGQHRCRLLAEALCEPEVMTTRGVQRHTRALADAMEARGVSVDAPYLRAGSADRLVLPEARTNRCWHGAASADNRAPTSVDAAARIGALLLDEALWSDDGCAWLVQRAGGATTGSAAGQRRSWTVAGGDIYDGAAGIAYFLADLAEVTDDARFKRAAAGALLHAAREADRSMRPQDATFHLGWTGVVYCLLRVGRRMTRPDLVEWGERIARKRLGQDDMVCETDDWLGGLAGSIMGLLGLAREGLSGPIVETANHLGHTLVARAAAGDGVRTWPDRHSTRAAPPLTGMAHGAAGIALALSELAMATGDNAYRKAALEAIAYERRRFSRSQLNWPDFRRHSVGGNGAHAGRRYAVTWCHGAPGIALARTHMWQRTGEDELRAEAELGLETTCRSLEWLVGDGMEHMVLCHGLSGNLAVVQHCHQAGLPLAPEHEVATAAAARHLRAVASLTDGDGGTSRWMRETPSLLTGAAGIGHSLLQEAGATTACLLAAPGPV